MLSFTNDFVFDKEICYAYNESLELVATIFDNGDIRTSCHQFPLSDLIELVNKSKTWKHE